MEVINIADKSRSKRTQDLLSVLNDLIEKVNAGEVEEFVAASVGEDGNVEIHACTKDVVGAVGMFEIGKHILISQEG